MVATSNSARSKARTQLGKRCNHTGHSVTLRGKDAQGEFLSSAAQTYPAGLCKALATVVLTCLVEMVSCNSGPDPTGSLTSAPGLTFPTAKPGRARSERRAGERVLAPPLTTRWSRQSRWSLAYKGPWQKTEHTNVQETRVIVGLLRHLARLSDCWNKRYLIFTDSMVALGCLSKGRSSAPALLRLCRQATAVILAFSLRPLLRYIPSELNIADGPSRGGPVGVAQETRAAHADRLPGPLSLGAYSSDLLARAKACSGFAGG